MVSLKISAVVCALVRDVFHHYAQQSPNFISCIRSVSITSLPAPRTPARRLPTSAMAAPAANGAPKKVSKFSVAKAATPQGAKRNAAETVVKGVAPEIPKASKVICVPPSLRMDGHLLVLDYCVSLPLDW